MIMTFLEAHVQPEHWATLEQAFRAGVDRLPSQITQTFLIHSPDDPTLWGIVSVWKSREALGEYRRSVETPGGILMFQSVGAEPKLSLFEITAHSP